MLTRLIARSVTVGESAVNYNAGVEYEYRDAEYEYEYEYKYEEGRTPEPGSSPDGFSRR